MGFKMKGWSPFNKEPKKRKGSVYVGDKKFSDKPMYEGHQPSTHLMSDDGDKTAWPTLFQTEKGVWYQPDNPEDEARRTGEIYKFNTHEEMVNFARKGNWKTKKK